MRYEQAILNFGAQPEQLETLYRSAVKEHASAEFKSDLDACYQAEPGNVLFSAWYYRLQTAGAEPLAGERSPRHWLLAIPLAILGGLALWGISFFENFLAQMPHFFVFWAPLISLFILAFLTLVARQGYRSAILAGAGLAVASLYTLFLLPGMATSTYQHTSILMAIHLPLLSWIAVGLVLLGTRPSYKERFAFLIKSYEVFVTAGVYLIVGVAFAGITSGMFQALGIQLPEVFMRLMMAGGMGLVSVIAVASIYDPRHSPLGQDFSQGLSRFIANLMRLMLPLTLFVLAIYLVVIPFNFLGPFLKRDVLIVYNVMLFAVVGMLIGATPLDAATLSPRLQMLLRRGILAAAIMAEIVSLYALAAIIYRTIEGGMTINRLTILGWNSINITILAAIIVTLLRFSRKKSSDQLQDTSWADGLHRVFARAMPAYIVWGFFIVIAIPLLFR